MTLLYFQFASRLYTIFSCTLCILFDLFDLSKSQLTECSMKLALSIAPLWTSLNSHHYLLSVVYAVT